jgi:hypothetical protein
MHSQTIEILSIFGDDIEHLHGNLFRIKRDKIKLSKSGICVEDGKLIYGNPRWFVNSKGEKQAKGIEKEKMDELKNSIQEDGLENPIRLRISEDRNFVEIINGERRFRCINDLCEKNIPCFNPETKSRQPADEIYDWIDCRVEFMDDKAALAIALKPNETSETIGDLANINLIKILRESGFDDQEIIKTTGKSVSWLRETDRIISLDETCLEHFKNEKINRTVAIQLALIENAEERIDLLEKIKQVAEKRHVEKINKTSEKINKATQNKEIQEASAKFAKIKGDEVSEEEFNKKAELEKQKIEKAEKEFENLSSKSATATSKDIEKIKINKPLSHKKIKSIYVDLINKIIENEGFDEEDNSYGLDLKTLESVVGVLSEILSGNKNSIDVLSSHCSLDIPEEEYEEEEDSEYESEEEAEYEEEEDSEYESEEEAEYEEEEDSEHESEEEAEYEEEEDSEHESEEEAEYEEDWEDDDETPPELEREFRDMAMIDDDVNFD